MRQTVGVDLTADFDADCEPAVLFGHVADLGSYPGWFDVVHKAQAEQGIRLPLDLDLSVSDEHSESVGASWVVDLRGRLGPMARSKRLRMVRTVYEPDSHVRFERQELDGRNHAPWVLDANVERVDGGSRLTVALHYGGHFGGALLRRMLLEEISRARPRLAALVASGDPDGG